MSTPSAEVSHQLFLGEEEISDVSLATFYVFDKENAGSLKSGVQLARGGAVRRRLRRRPRLWGVRRGCVEASEGGARGAVAVVAG